MATTDQQSWWNDRQHLAGFLAWLLDQHPNLTAGDIVYAVEKPWKYSPEHDTYLEASRPDQSDSTPRLNMRFTTDRKSVV